MKKIIFEADENLIMDAEDVLDEEGLDIEVAIHMLLKRIVKERTIAFLLRNNSKNNNQVENVVSVCEQKPSVAISTGSKSLVAMSENDDRGNMTKSLSIRLLRGKGLDVGTNVTYASKNRGAYNYWANPEFGMLSVDWNIILNDWINRKIYLFLVPANSIKEDQLVPRNDKTYLIDLQIMYNDITFTDNRSGISFAKYFVAEIQY